jgi:hypothetical protein
MMDSLGAKSAAFSDQPSAISKQLLPFNRGVAAHFG